MSRNCCHCVRPEGGWKCRHDFLQQNEALCRSTVKGLRIDLAEKDKELSTLKEEMKGLEEKVERLRKELADCYRTSDPGFDFER